MRPIKLLIFAILFAVPIFNIIAQDAREIKPIEKQVQQIEQEIGFEELELFERALKGENRSSLDEGFIEAKFKLNSSEFLRLQNDGAETISFNLIIDNEQLNIKLFKHEILSSDFVITTQTNSGMQTVDIPSASYFKGMIAGKSGSLVTLSLFENEMIVHIHLNGEDYVLQKNPNSKLKLDVVEEYIIVNESKIDFGKSYSCDTEDTDDYKITQPSSTSAIPDPNKCVRVYVECDHQLYLDNNSNITNVTNFVTAVFNQVFTIYQNESINMVISQINIWTVPDPYPTLSSFSALNAFRNNLAGNFNGDIAQLLATGASGLGGRAYLDKLCNKSLACGYNNIFYQYNTYPVYSWSVYVITHEMGHNLGSRHTHDCVWNGNNTAIDGCGPQAGYNAGCNGPLPPAGTIMSYCHAVSGIGVD